MVSNALAIASNETLSETHPVRRFAAPHVHGSITINRAAYVKLCGERGTTARQGGCPWEEILRAITRLKGSWVYQSSFEQMLEAKGEFPDGFLEKLPFVEDGRRLWRVFQHYVQGYLEL